MKYTIPHPMQCVPQMLLQEGATDENDLIDKILQIQPPNTMPLDDMVTKSEDNPWTNLCLVDSSLAHVKMVEFGPSKTLKINPSLSAHQEEDLGTMLREHLDDFSWSYKKIKGVCPLVYNHHIYIKER